MCAHPKDSVPHTCRSFDVHFAGFSGFEVSQPEERRHVKSRHGITRFLASINPNDLILIVADKHVVAVDRNRRRPVARLRVIPRIGASSFGGRSRCPVRCGQANHRIPDANRVHRRRIIPAA